MKVVVISRVVFIIASAVNCERQILFLYHEPVVTQAKTGTVDWDWIARVVGRLEKEHPSLETSLLKTRLGVLSKKLSTEEAVREYRELLSTPVQDRFTFTGVKDARCVDSYFDPWDQYVVNTF